MKKLIYTASILMIGIGLATGSSIYAGTLSPSSAPTTDATMYSLTAIYEKLTTGTTSETAGVLDAPASVSASQYTLEEIFNALPEWVTLSNSTTTVQEGFYEATTLNAVDSDLTAANITSGTTIFGVAGSASPDLGLPKTGVTVSETTYHSNRICADGGTGACDDGYYQRGKPTSGTRFTDNGDETISDSVTGLMWTKCFANTSGDDCSTGSVDNKYYQEAIDYCEDLSFASQTDWRIPNVYNLISLSDYGQFSSAVYDTYFPQSNSSVWSSTAISGNPDYVYKINNSSGLITFSNTNISTQNAVRCVRDDS